MRVKAVTIILHVILPLIVGFAIYYFFRQDTWLHTIFPKQAPIHADRLNNFQWVIIFSGPDFCWSYSLASALFIWYRWNNKPIRFFSTAVLLLVLLSELIQLFFPRQFSFDWIDLVAAFVAYVLSRISLPFKV